MIARIWRGWASQGRAGNYQRHCETEVTGQLREVSGFRGAQLLRRDEDAAGGTPLRRSPAVQAN